MSTQRQEPTTAQINYFKALCQQLGYDEDEYDLGSLSLMDLREIISEMVKELDS